MNYKACSIFFLALLISIQISAQEQKEIIVESFSDVKFDGSAQWVLVPSEIEKVVIDCKNKDVFDYIEVRNTGSTLTVSTTDKSKNITKLFKSVTIKVYFKSINSVYLSGVGSVFGEDETHTGQLLATLKGTGDMDLNVRCAEFTGNMQGTGGMSIKGKTAKGLVRVEGVGGFDGYELRCENMNVTVSGVGGAKVYASDKLTATLNGVGSIKYKGNPKTKNLNTNGIGNIKNVSE